ncbi:hypothetical protein Ae707Ps1_3393c [Pseudonocardia sp. Ae707_Ps1]|nr:hypothetical protein Ae707Ps1_3393c [Pseudonocardia sp. Ae707_Ps1]
MSVSVAVPGAGVVLLGPASRRTAPGAGRGAGGHRPGGVPAAVLLPGALRSRGPRRVGTTTGPLRRRATGTGTPRHGRCRTGPGDTVPVAVAGLGTAPPAGRLPAPRVPGVRVPRAGIVGMHVRILASDHRTADRSSPGGGRRATTGCPAFELVFE